MAQVARVASLGGGEALVLAGDALMTAAARDLPGAEVEYFLSDEGCLELVWFRQVVETVVDPAREIALTQARQRRPSARLGSEIGAALHVALSPVGEKILTGQSSEIPAGRGAQVALLADGLVLTAPEP